MIPQHGEIHLKDYLNEKRSLFEHYTGLSLKLHNSKIQPRYHSKNIGSSPSDLVDLWVLFLYGRIL